MALDRTALERWKPALGKRGLLLVAGLLWIAVGTMLMGMAWRWLAASTGRHLFVYPFVGAVAALVIHHFGFLKIVDRNLGRIVHGPGRRCAFAFMPARSYLTVVLMMALGIGLRHSPVPRVDLSVLYVAIGAALILSSFRYLRVVVVSLGSDLPLDTR